MKWTTGTSKPTESIPRSAARRGPLRRASIWFRSQPFRTRLAIGFALSLALLEIAAGLFPAPRAEPEPAKVVSFIVSVHTHTPPPPTPTPVPMPAPIPTLEPTPPAHFTPAVHVAARAPAPRAAAIVHRIIGGHRPKNVLLLTPAPLHASPHAAALVAGMAGRAGGGTGTGAGAGNGDSGLGGTGSGTGGNGNGNGEEANAAPCGDVTFYGRVDHVDPDGTVHEHVRIEVRLADGTVISDELHWLWTYKSERDNPFDPSLPAEQEAHMQLPPADYDLRRQSEATIFALKHTTPSGVTTLPPCPTSTAPASRGGV